MEVKQNMDFCETESNKIVKKKNGIKFTKVIAALSVRCLLVLHNILAVWRVVITRDNSNFWGLVALNVFILVESVLVIRYNQGNEWQWYCLRFQIISN